MSDAMKTKAAKRPKIKHIMNGDERNGWYCYACSFFTRDVAAAAKHDGTFVVRHAGQTPAEVAPHDEQMKYIGDLRRELFLPTECAWNGVVRDVTANLEEPGMRVDKVAVLKRLAEYLRNIALRNELAGETAPGGETAAQPAAEPGSALAETLKSAYVPGETCRQGFGWCDGKHCKFCRGYNAGAASLSQRVRELESEATRWNEELWAEKERAETAERELAAAREALKVCAQAIFGDDSAPTLNQAKALAEAALRRTGEKPE